MGNGNGNLGNRGFDPACPQSDHIDEERARLKAASVKHFAEGGRDKETLPPMRKDSATSGKRIPAGDENEDLG